MKKLLSCILCFSFLLMGCNSNEFKESSIDKKAFVAKLDEVNGKVQSGKMDGHVNLTITDNYTISSQLSFDADLVFNPAQAKAKVSVMVPDPRNVNSFEAELYLKDNIVYSKILKTNTSGWIKQPIPIDLSLNRITGDSTEELPDKIYENNTHYLIKEQLNKEDLDKLILEKGKDASVFSLFKIHQLEIETYIDKNTFYFSKIKINAEVEYSAKAKVEVELNLSKQNEIKEIIVPDEALKAE